MRTRLSRARAPDGDRSDSVAKGEDAVAEGVEAVAEGVEAMGNRSDNVAKGEEAVGIRAEAVAEGEDAMGNRADTMGRRLGLGCRGRGHGEGGALARYDGCFPANPFPKGRAALLGNIVKAARCVKDSVSPAVFVRADVRVSR
ncbi:hypothetical protein [Polyangium fumosum]|uniref:Uncharacterized protein n=1 Tax=Polyangium fumosum TaxID=889272 RepID=A0A4U1J448_9BACT|nr:hypothetical protein [Polyangium fumosum]TKD01989.1 hypothetical protein E8A74_29420 [Polyangium fumosum]